MEQALPVYNRAQNKVAENMKALQTLADDPDRLYRSLTNSVAGNSTTVMDQLVLAMVRDHDSGVLDATRKLINANNVRKCLRQQEKSLHNAIHHETARALSNSAFRTSPRREIADLERVLHNAPDAQDLQARLNDARDRLQRINARLDKLGSTALPAELEKRKREMQENQQRVEQEMEAARRQVRQALQAQLPELQRFYRNLAGEAQLGKAQLLQARG